MPINLTNELRLAALYGACMLMPPGVDPKKVQAMINELGSQFSIHADIPKDVCFQLYNDLAKDSTLITYLNNLGAYHGSGKLMRGGKEIKKDDTTPGGN